MAVKITKEQKDTIEYYNTHADEYCAETRDVNMSGLYAEFGKYLKPGCKILDLGCGSGRDSKYFYDKGYQVVAVDPSIEMCKKTRELVPIDVLEMRAEDLKFENEFDAVWACASLLHINRKYMPLTLDKILKSLKSKGVLYASWKTGNDELTQSDRMFTNYSKEEVIDLFEASMSSLIVELWITQDSIKRNISWTNVIIKKQ
ncbi:class I SAM-dependent methyltransferase [[Clostridium] innocuum]|mgnify:CR=1 FL=1|jgi:SAM-dependent methyltransferase|nr:class I SAM-dependent methyltransferase [Erysipelotrichaceae bacterium]MCR0384229.1 class I SAM-dependent methyltransferase [[Clostridium] innocuum]MCR0415163.1 class I SAM-dependent methyltransferase [[Clostridium] innocuum]MCR0533212.1 class I SAM-dependent methyltransferase [[Clostridium] innocuum]MCR0540403.1 class I SAM-dependent methyltransferase [[Clostridium] innocuum]